MEDVKTTSLNSSAIFQKITKIHEDFKEASEFIIDSIILGEKILEKTVNPCERE